MPKKESTTPTKTTANKTTRTTAAAKTTAARTPRVTNSRHSKVSSAAPAGGQETLTVNTEDIIARLAYGYWEARGFQGGSELEDWFRAEAEFRAQSAA